MKPFSLDSLSAYSVIIVQAESGTLSACRPASTNQSCSLPAPSLHAHSLVVACRRSLSWALALGSADRTLCLRTLMPASETIDTSCAGNSPHECHFRCHLGDLLLDGLEPTDRAAKLLPDPRLRDGRAPLSTQAARRRPA